MILSSSEGQDGVTIVDTGDTLCDVDLLLMMMLLPVAGELTELLFIKQIPIRHRKIMPATTAKLMMSGHFILSNKGVVDAGGISA